MANPLSLATSTGGKRKSKNKKNAKIGGLTKANQQVQRLQNRLKNMDKQAGKVGAAAIHTVETQGALFVTAALTGRFGAQAYKKIGNVDARLVVGALGVGYGLYGAWMGNEKMAPHALALGQGVLAAPVYEMAHDMGVKSAKGGRAKLSFGQDYDEGSVDDFGREVHVTPSMGRAGLRRR